MRTLGIYRHNRILRRMWSPWIISSLILSGAKTHRVTRFNVVGLFNERLIQQSERGREDGRLLWNPLLWLLICAISLQRPRPALRRWRHSARCSYNRAMQSPSLSENDVEAMHDSPTWAQLKRERVQFLQTQENRPTLIKEGSFPPWQVVQEACS